MNNLVIVESPTKARTLSRFLGADYQIEASMGHVRDLPKSDFGIDIEKNFEPQYVIPRDKLKMVNGLKKQALEAKTLWLATDPDREGEAIAWHISELLKSSQIRNSIKRVVFHEITEDAIKEAFKTPRDLDLKLVDAQQARRVLDRLVGYKLSPLLWVKVKRGLSAGRVQSVALRLIVEREREVLAFKAEEYWIIEVELSAADPAGNVIASEAPAPTRSDRGEKQSTNMNEQSSSSSKIASSSLDKLGTPRNDGNIFTATLIELNGEKLVINNEKASKEHVKNLEKASYRVEKITKKEVRRYPYPPFTTSTMQQAAANRLGFSAKRTMMLAQNLYEHGLITYMRTDSFNLSPQAISAARAYIGQSLGKDYLPPSPRFYKSRSKNIQEAHEAIRPTDVSLPGQALQGWQGMNRDHARLYELIWKRFVACQMAEALVDQTTVDVNAHLRGEAKDTPGVHLGGVVYLLRATGSVIKFDGWLRLEDKQSLPSGEGRRSKMEDGESEDGKDRVLPELEENELLNLIQLLPGQHFTQPPARYTEASLIKKLEELGIGRPSTYAPILSTIQERFYVERQERKFLPTALGFAVTDFLVKYFSDIIDYQFTAQMEDELDEISRGERQWKPTISEFYKPFEKKLEETEKVAEHVKVAVEKSGKKCPKCEKDLIFRIGKFGKFLACSGFPDCKYTEALEEKVINAKCPEDSGDIIVRRTKKGKTFYGCKNWPGCKYASWTKPKTSPT